MENKQAELDAVWAKLRAAWIETEKHKTRLNKLIGFLKEVEWANRRQTGEDARSMVAHAMRGYGGQFFRDPTTNEWTWDNLYAWVDALELNDLSEQMHALDKELSQRRHEKQNATGLNHAEGALRELFGGEGYVISCQEHTIRHTSYASRSCVIIAQRQKPGKPEERDTVEIVRTKEWDEAIEEAKKWLFDRHNPLLGSYRPGGPADALFDTDKFADPVTEMKPDELDEPPPDQPDESDKPKSVSDELAEFEPSDD